MALVSIVILKWQYRSALVQRCQITEVVFYTKVLVNNILVGLDKILDYAGVRLERLDCNTYIIYYISLGFHNISV